VALRCWPAWAGPDDRAGWQQLRQQRLQPQRPPAPMVLLDRVDEVFESRIGMLWSWQPAPTCARLVHPAAC
jgi:hypothetical protein